MADLLYAAFCSEQYGSCSIGRSIICRLEVKALLKALDRLAINVPRKYMLSSYIWKRILESCSCISLISMRECSFALHAEAGVDLFAGFRAYWAATIDVASAKREGLNPELLARLRNSSRILLTWVSLPGMKQSVSDLIEQIEALLLADVPPQVPHNEVFSAYDPLHHPHATQEGMPPNGSDAYYAQMTGLMRPQQAYMLSDPMMGVSPPVDYGPLGGLYWDVSAVPLW